MDLGPQQFQLDSTNGSVCDHRTVIVRVEELSKDTSNISIFWCDAESQDSGMHQPASAVPQTAVHFESSGGGPVVQQQAPPSPHPVTAANTDGTFRQPLPPALARPRLPSQGNIVIRSPTGVRHPLQGLDPRLQVQLHKLPGSSKR